MVRISSLLIAHTLVFHNCKYHSVSLGLRNRLDITIYSPPISSCSSSTLIGYYTGIISIIISILINWFHPTPCFTFHRIRLPFIIWVNPTLYFTCLSILPWQSWLIYGNPTIFLFYVWNCLQITLVLPCVSSGLE